MKKMILLAGCAVALSACAGRDPNPIPVAQAYDNTASCNQMRSEYLVNEDRIDQLNKEHNAKIVQNGVVGGVGLFFPPLWFGLDTKGAALQDRQSYEARNRYLSSQMSARRC